MLIKDLITDAIQNTNIADPQGLAKYIDEKLSDDERLHDFHELLLTFVHRQIDLHRMSSYRPPKAYIGVKAQYLRNTQWDNELKKRYLVDGVGKIFADLTKDDVLIIAKSRRELADKFNRVAIKMEKIAELMDQHNATIVADLDGSLPELQNVELIGM